MHAVCVSFDVRPGKMPEFLQLMKAQARNSLDLEAGCHRFDVCLSGDGRTVFLYELYLDADAFEDHLASAHLREFDSRVGALVNGKDVRTYGLVE